jgi:hypothetical protein
MTKAQQTIRERISSDFKYHAPQSWDDVDRQEAVRSAGKSMALELTELCPPSRELNHALNKIDEAVMWANAAIARHGRSSPETAA